MCIDCKPGDVLGCYWSTIRSEYYEKNEGH